MKIKTLYLSLIIFVSLLLVLPQVQAAQVANKTISIDLDQTNPAAPTVISVTLENDNPEEYKLTLTDHFFTIKEVDTADTVLFEGQVKRYLLDEANGQAIEIPENPLSLNLPYYEGAKKIRVYDETNAQVLEIDLGLYAIGPTPTPAPRFGECNKCGYCKNKKPPQDLNQCMKCLYPDFIGNPEGTLQVDPKTNKSVSPRTGTFYSQLGCIDVGLAGFRDPSASGGVLNVILARLLFPITGGLALIALIYGSFLVMTAQKNPEQLERGKKWIYGALIGVVFTFCVILLIRIIGGDLLKIPGLDI